MNLVFHKISSKSFFLAKLLRLFFKSVYYMEVNNINDHENRILEKRLIKSGIYPLPIGEIKNISIEDYSMFTVDPNKYSLKKTDIMTNINIIKFFNELFLINKDDQNIIRQIVFQKVFNQQIHIGAYLNIWREYKKKKILFISFDFSSFYIPFLKKGIYKIIFPINLKILKKVFKIVFGIFKRKKKNEPKKNAYNTRVAYLLHKGLSYRKSYNKIFYYNSNRESAFNIKNILHINLESNYVKKKLKWINFEINNYSYLIKNFFKLIKCFKFIKSFDNFIGISILLNEYNKFLCFDSFLKNQRSLKICLIDHDSITPKGFLLALKKNKITTISSQQRINNIWLPWHSTFLDYYFVYNNFVADIIKKKKSQFNIENIVISGSVKENFIKKFNYKNISEDILCLKKNKKLILALGHHVPMSSTEQESSIWINKYSAKLFLQNCLAIAQNNSNCFVIIRYKYLPNFNFFFNEVIDQINKSKNILICNNYDESYRTYKICSVADLIIGEYTSLVDECIASEKAVLVHDFSYQFSGHAKKYFKHLPEKIFCTNKDELLKKTKEFLMMDDFKANQFHANNEKIDSNKLPLDIVKFKLNQLLQ